MMFYWFLSNSRKMVKQATPSMPKVVAYLRVSTLDQDIEKNKTDILRFANQHDLEKVRFVEEVASGRIPWRERRIATVLEELQDGDAIIVAELSRLGRSMLECMEILALATRKGIRIYSVKGHWQLDQSIQSKIIALAFSMASEIERDLISQRTKEALRFKKAQGMTLGRPKGPGKSKLDAFRPEIESLLASGSTQKFIAQRYHTTQANLHNWLKKHGIKPARTP
jgi:DNA invertase Pin-like site-specific DNA recombinase